MVEAAESHPGTDPDRCSFTVTLHTARDLLVKAADSHTGGTDPARLLTRHILSSLLPPRRLRVSTRKVKSPISRYAERLPDGRPDRSRPVTSLDVTVLEPDLPPELPTATHTQWHIPPADRRRQRVLDLLRRDPDRRWRPRDIAHHLGDVTVGTLHRQLNRWADAGLIHKPRSGFFTATPDQPPPLTRAGER